MHIKDIQDIIKIIEVGQDIILVIEVVTVIIPEVIQGMEGTIIVITEEVVIEVGVGHMKDQIEMEETVEAQAVVDLGPVQEQIQIEIGLDVLNVGDTIILQGNV